MEWNDLRRNWQARESRSLEGSRLRPNARQRLWSRIRSRDWIESAVAIALLPFFGVIAVQMVVLGWYGAAFFAAFLAAAMILVVLRLRTARKAIPTPDPARSLVDFLQAERRALVAQVELLSTVAFWYWGPIAIGTVGLFGSVRGLAPATFAYAVGVAGLCVAIEWLNRFAVRTSLTPAIAAIDTQLDAINKEIEESDAS